MLLNIKFINKKYMIHFIDEDGYKYCLDYARIRVARNNPKSQFNKFFKSNPYTYENICNFFRIENIALSLDKKDFKTNAKEKMLFIDLRFDKPTYVTWNQIQHHTYMYRYDYYEFLTKRKLERTITKEEAINIVWDMYKKKGTTLTDDDFHPKQKDGIGIRTVYKYWGTVSNLQKEFGFPNGKQKISDIDAVNEILLACNYIRDTEKRTIITYYDIEKSKFTTYNYMSSYNQKCRNALNKSIREFLEENGFELQKSGCGMNYIYEDGEKVESTYEYIFTNFLRNHGLKYNKDYFRSIRYNTLDNSYSGNMNCDYKILSDNSVLYVEIAGILSKTQYIKCYKEDIPINRKSKENYRQKLNMKRKILEQNNLNYLILFPPEITVENLEDIFGKCFALCA